MGNEYSINASVKGIAPVIHHKFGTDILQSLMKSEKKLSSQEKYAKEWLTTMYVTADGYLFQPATHLEASMIKASTDFKVPGKGGSIRKSFKDYFKSWVRVEPDEILHYWNGEPVPAPDESLILNPTDHLRVNLSRMTIERKSIARTRLEIGEGWELHFVIRVIDDLIEPDLLRAVLNEAGRSKGISDSRPRYGRFAITRFEIA